MIQNKKTSFIIKMISKENDKKKNMIIEHFHEFLSNIVEMFDGDIQ